MTGGGYLREQLAAPFREVRHVLVCVRARACVFLCACTAFFRVPLITSLCVRYSLNKHQEVFLI